jgi:hypothetical protein
LELLELVAVDQMALELQTQAVVVGLVHLQEITAVQALSLFVTLHHSQLQVEQV